MIDPLILDEVADYLEKIHHYVQIRADALADEKQRILDEELTPMCADKDMPTKVLIETLFKMIRRARNHEKMTELAHNLGYCKEGYKTVDDIAHLWSVDDPMMAEMDRRIFFLQKWRDMESQSE